MYEVAGEVLLDQTIQVQWVYLPIKLSHFDILWYFFSLPLRKRDREQKRKGNYVDKIMHAFLYHRKSPLYPYV